MTEKSIDNSERKNLSVVWRLFYFFGMMVYVMLAIDGAYSFIEEAPGLAKFHLWGAFIGGIGICLLVGAGYAAFLFGYKAFMPVARHEWIKNKIGIMLTLSFLVFLWFTIAIPPTNQYRSRANNSDVKSKNQVNSSNQSPRPN